MGHGEEEKRSLATMDHVPELRNEQDMRTWKREYNIRQREAEWKKKQDELLMQRQVAWEVEKLEKENRLAAAREAARRRHLEERVKKKHGEVEREYQDKCRDIEINKKKNAWEDRQKKEIVEQVVASREDAKVREENLQAAKGSKCEAMRSAARQRAEARAHDLSMNDKRQEKIREKELARKQREAERTERVKNDKVAEKGAQVSRFADKQVPMQSVLVSMLSGSPGVTSSTAVDAKREENLARRDADRNRNAASYIQELNQYAEEQKARFRGTTEHQILTGERGVLSF